MIEELKKAVVNEIEILRDMSVFVKKLEAAEGSEKKMLSEGIESLREKMKSVNDSIPSLTIDILSEEPKLKIMEKTEPVKPAENKERGSKMISSSTREEYLKELEISEKLIKKVRLKKNIAEEKIDEFQKSRGYLKLSNKLFLGSATKLAKGGYFGDLPYELKKSNLEILFETYIAMILLSVTLSFFVALFATVMMIALGFSILRVIWLPIVAPVAVFFILYYYPSAEKNSISSRIDEELPFAVIHMSSISGSGIEPSEIFKIIGLSKDYPFLRKEIRKVLNQINIYGFDLVTALNNVSKSTANPRLAELFIGLSTTINSGGDLSDFFQKRADSLLTTYKLEKERAIKVAETFMDIYISVVIAAPMILMLMLVMISVSGIQIGLTPYQLTIATIGGVALINFVFLGYLQTKQS